MSDISTNDAGGLDIREQIARIDRAITETGKCQAKLAAEAEKSQRERLLAPVLAAAALGGFIAALLPATLRGLGFH